MEPLVTAQELCEATREVCKELVMKSKEELLEEWMEWFKKKGPSYIRDSVKKGLYRVTLELPFQPLFQKNGEPEPSSYNWKGKSLWKRLTELLPGCKIEYVEEEYEEDCEVKFPGYVLEISWKLKKKKKGFVAEELVLSSTTVASTMASTMATATVSSTTTSADTS